MLLAQEQLYKNQIPIEQAMETADLMLGTDKSRGYCLEVICADSRGEPLQWHSAGRSWRYLCDF